MLMREVHIDGPLSLKNDGALEVVFLGTGTAFAKDLYQTNFLLIKGDTHILVDFGMTGPVALNALGVKTEEIGVFLPTHSHADHIGGVEYLTLKNRYYGIPAGNPKLTLMITEEYKDVLWEQSLRGGLEYNELNSEGARLSYADFYNFHTIERIDSTVRGIFQAEFGGIKIELFQTNHIPGEAETPIDAFITYGLFIDDTVFISGDTKFDLELINRYKDRASVMFHDASLNRNAVHASFEELQTLPEAVRQKMFLVHYQDNATAEDAAGFAGLGKQNTRYIF